MNLKKKKAIKKTGIGSLGFFSLGIGRMAIPVTSRALLGTFMQKTRVLFVAADNFFVSLRQKVDRRPVPSLKHSNSSITLSFFYLRSFESIMKAPHDIASHTPIALRYPYLIFRGNRR